ncbi:MAG: manganese-binding transcriptional regulator MntR [Planctomycetota bacterium]|nr:manganese-binding transcriptional regulator MntR [Planctomycetota bacterium]
MMSAETRKSRRSQARRPSASSSAVGHHRTRSDHKSEIAEDYVELIDDLIEDTGEARAVDLAKHLGVTHVTVTKTIARLKAEGLVTSAPYRSIFLTNSGKKMAEFTRRRHQTVLEFLIALGVPRPDAEADTEGIEHHISPRTLEAMKRHLNAR